MSGARRIAMWSGPRNISTALMRSWEARGDCFVTDEPLYAHYLKATGRAHPGADEVMAQHECDAAKVVAWLTGPVPESKPIWYQKHMAHHLLPGMDTAWVGRLTNVMLIREPREMLVSLSKVLGDSLGAHETGLPQQAELWRRLADETGTPPPVIDAKDVLLDPRGMLSALCARLDVPFTERMLNWPPGPRSTDGVWARHWYGAVEKSTGFEPWRERSEIVPDSLRGVLEECEALYRGLWSHRLTAG